MKLKPYIKILGIDYKIELHDLNKDEDIVDALAHGFLSIIENNEFLNEH